MSMEQRHREIRERAGREEARLNQEFIDFLKKWGTPMLMVVAALSLGYVGLDYLKKQRAAGIDAAFKDLQGVSPGGFLAASPDSLLNVADTHGDVVGVSYMARLGAGDAWLQAVRTGLRPGAVLTPEGAPEMPEDLLSDDEKALYLSSAADAFGSVLRDAEDRKGHEIHAIGALYGLAAVEEARGQKDAARTHLERVKAIAEECKFELHTRIVEKRLEALASSAGMPTLVSRSELPAPPEAPVIPPMETPLDLAAPDAPSPAEPGTEGVPAPAGDVPSTPEGETAKPENVPPPSEPPADPAPASEPK